MTFELPLWVISCAAPWAIAWAWSYRYSSTLVGGGGWFPASSERSDFRIFSGLACVPISLVNALVYWIGRAKGWWA